VAGVILIPLYTRHLAPETFGVYGLAEAIIQVAVVVLALGFNVAYLQWFAELPEERRRRLLTVALVLIGVGSAVGGGLLALAGVTGIGSRLTGLPPRPEFWTIGPLIVLGVLSSLLLTQLRSQRRAIAFSLASVIRLFATVGASIYTVTVSPGGVAGVLYGRLGGEAAAMVFLVTVTRRSFGGWGEWPEFSRMMRYGLPIVVSSIVITILGITGRYLLTWLGSLADVGIYTAATKVAGVVSLLMVQPFGIAWGGLMFQIAKEPEARAVYAQILFATWTLGWAVIAATGLLTPELFALLTSRAYVAAERVFPWLLVNQLMILMQYPVGIGLYLRGRTGLLASVYVAGLAVNLAMGLGLVRWAGSTGAAIAWCASNVTITAATWTIGQRLYPLQWSRAKFLAVAAGGSVLLYAGASAAGQVWSVTTIVRAAAAVVVVAGCGWLVLRRLAVPSLELGAMPQNQDTG